MVGLRSSAVLCVFLVACGVPDGSPVPDSPAIPTFDFDAVTDAQWQTLAERRLYFGHQSVGDNVVRGIKVVLYDNPEIPLRVVDTKDLQPDSGPGLFHARVGVNGDVESKVEELQQILGGGRAPDVAGLQLCWADVTSDASEEADRIFARYQAGVTSLRQSHPGVTIIHLTMPLRSIEGRKARLAAKLTGRTTERDLNRVRNRYNALIRAAYGGREPLFDIAALEAVAPDGTPSFFRAGDRSIPFLSPWYTVDGGHLNERGQDLVARAFLAFLANLPAPGASTD